MNEDSYNLAEIWQFAGSGRTAGYSGQLGLAQFGDLNPKGSPSDNRKRNRNDVYKGLVSTSSDDANEQVNVLSSSNLCHLLHSGNPQNENAACDEAETGEKPCLGKGLDRSAQEPAKSPKQDYIHVRARRGQATDSHSLAERARREKISERMKILQDLVPGCNKVIGKALVLDEIINYIQSLQRQVEFLSMKLEAVNSRINPGIDAFPVKDAFDPSTMSFGSQGGRPSSEWLHMQVGSGFHRKS